MKWLLWSMAMFGAMGFENILVAIFSSTNDTNAKTQDLEGNFG